MSPAATKRRAPEWTRERFRPVYQSYLEEGASAAGARHGVSAPRIYQLLEKFNLSRRGKPSDGSEPVARVAASAREADPPIRTLAWAIDSALALARRNPDGSYTLGAEEMDVLKRAALPFRAARHLTDHVNNAGARRGDALEADGEEGPDHA